MRRRAIRLTGHQFLKLFRWDWARDSLLMEEVGGSTASQSDPDLDSGSSLRPTPLTPSPKKARVSLKRPSDGLANIQVEKPRKRALLEQEDEALDPPVFYFHNGFRKLKPYWYTYKSFAKRRWVDRELLEVFNKEFHTRSPMFFENAVKTGRITVNGQRIGTDYRIKDLDVIRNRAHRHELPVLIQKIEIIAETDSILAVNKPSSIPVHTCGRYHYNTVSYLLSHEHGYQNLRISFRLDRATSGLLLFAKNLKTDQQIKKLIAERKVEKEYLCKVDGVFPDCSFFRGEVSCEEAMDKLVPKMGIIYVTKTGKPCLTTFQRLWTDGKTSVVRCFPKTGRTHQIRVHLQFLGYPIVNDVLYNSPAFGPERGKNAEYGKSIEELIQDVSSSHSATRWILDAPDYEPPSFNQDQETQESRPTLPLSSEDVDPYCPDCQIQTKEPDMEHMHMFLHCLRYKCSDWVFETPLPDWARRKCDTTNERETSHAVSQISSEPC